MSCTLATKYCMINPLLSDDKVLTLLNSKGFKKISDNEFVKRVGYINIVFTFIGQLLFAKEEAAPNENSCGLFENIFTGMPVESIEDLQYLLKHWRIHRSQLAV